MDTFSFLSQAALDESSLLVNGVPDRLHFIMHSLFLDASKRPTKDKLDQLQKAIRNIFGSIDNRARSFGDKATMLRPASQQAVTSLITANWFVAGPIKFELNHGNKDDAKRTDAIKKHLQDLPEPPAYGVVHFAVAIDLLQDSTWSSYIHNRPEEAKKFLHNALVRAVSYPDHTPTVNNIRDRLCTIIRRAYEPLTTVDRVHGDDPAKLEANKKAEAAIDTEAKKLLELINDIRNLNLQPTSSSSSSSSGGKVTYVLSEYRHVSVHLALDVLAYFGT